MAQVMNTGARGEMRIQMIPEAASQTFKTGDFLTVDSNGRCVQGISAGSRVGATTSSATMANTGGRIVGRALADASGTTGQMIPVMLVEGTEFMLPVHHATAASAVPNTNQIGKGYELIYVNATPKYWAVSLDNVTNVKVVIKDMVPGPEGHDQWDGQKIATAASTKQYGHVWVQFIDDYALIDAGVQS